MSTITTELTVDQVSRYEPLVRTLGQSANLVTVSAGATHEQLGREPRAVDVRYIQPADWQPQIGDKITITITRNATETKEGTPAWTRET